MSIPLENVGNATLEDLLAKASADFEITFESIRAGGTELIFPTIADMPSHLERLVARAGTKGKVELPLWAKIWPTALVLSALVQSLPQGASVLEVGAGVGAAGLFAAKSGCDVALTDSEEEALLFARIATLKNNLENRVRWGRVDFTRDRLDERFDYVLGSEILYRESVYAPFLEFMDAHLAHKPEAEVILALDGNRAKDAFFGRAAEKWRVAVREFPLSPGPDQEEPTRLAVFRLRRRNHDY